MQGAETRSQKVERLRRSLSYQKLSGAEIVSQFRSEAAIWYPAKQAKLAMFWIPAYAGMTKQVGFQPL